MQMAAWKDKTNKAKHKSGPGAGLRVTDCVAQHKKSTLYHTKRGRAAKAPEHCSQRAKTTLHVCVRVNENPFLLQPADGRLSAVQGQ